MKATLKSIGVLTAVLLATGLAAQENRNTANSPVVRKREPVRQRHERSSVSTWVE
jgi:hypothetical protein